MFRQAILFAAFLLSFSLFAQEQQTAKQNFSISLQAGYGLGIPREYELETNESRELIITTRVPYNKSGGLQLGLDLGYDFNDKLRLSLYGHFQRSKFTKINNYYRRHINDIQKDFTDYQPETFQFTSISLSALLRFRSDYQFAHFHPFCSIGPSIYLYGSEAFTREHFDEYSQSRIAIAGNTSMSISAGAIANIGVERKLTNQLSVSIALQFRGGYIAPNLKKITSVKKNGVDVTHQYSVSLLQTQYVKNLTVDAFNVPSIAYLNRLDLNKPTPSKYYPRAYVGSEIMIGISYYFH